MYLCYWLIVVFPLAKGELPEQNTTTLITRPPKAYPMSKKIPLAAESERKLRSYGKYVLMAASGILLGYGLYW